MDQNTTPATPAINARAMRRWINEQYEGAASATGWTLKECIDFVEEYHVDGVAAFTRTVIRTNLNANARTSNQVQDAVRHLERKLTRLTSWRGRGATTTLYRLTATLEDGAVAVRMVEADRTLTGQPDKVWAEVYLDQNMNAVAMYRMAKAAHQSGVSAMVKALLEEHPFGPAPIN